MATPNESNAPSDDLNDVLKQLSVEATVAKAPMALLSQSQATAVARLELLFKLRLQQASVGGIHVRTHALIAGPSGSGKTTAVRAFTRRHGLPLITMAFGQWTIWNAKSEKYTLDQVGEFVRSQRCGVIFIDEIDKATSKISLEQAWTSCVSQEIYALLDADERLANAGFSSEDRSRLHRSFLVVAAGAWQEHWTESVKASDGSDYLERVMADSHMADELFFRFAEPILGIVPPSEEEIGEFIKRMHRDVTVPLPSKAELRRLQKAAVSSGRAMRFVENYAGQLALAAMSDVPLAKLLSMVPPVDRGASTTPMGETKSEAERRLFAELRAAAAYIDESAHALIKMVVGLDPAMWLPLYRALAINSLGDVTIDNLRLSKRDLDSLPSAIRLEERLADLDHNRACLLVELREAFAKIAGAAIAYSSVGNAAKRKTHENVLLYFGAWVSMQIEELLHGPCAYELPPDLLRALEDFHRHFLCWERSYTQLVILLT